MKKSIRSLLVGCALVLSIFSAGAYAQDSIPVSAAEGGHSGSWNSADRRRRMAGT